MKTFVALLLPLSVVMADALEKPAHQTAQQIPTQHRTKEFKAFTGRIVGSNVRLRTGADIESAIVKELAKDDLFVVVGEDNEFYRVAPSADCKAFIFRSFVLDNVVEGNRVNIRLEPNLDSPIIGHVNAGTRLEGKIADKNPKWLEITPPDSTAFYVAKEYIEYAGGPEYKVIQDKRLSTVRQLIDTAQHLTESELRKSFEEMDIARIKNNYQAVIDDFPEFHSYVEKAKTSLSEVQKLYLQRNIAFLKAKSSRLSASSKVEGESLALSAEEQSASKEKLRIWEPVEQALYLSWAAMHRAKTMDDFYLDQQLKSKTISGVLQAFAEPVKSKPGDYILTENGLPIAYLYSTHLDLSEHIGKSISLLVSERPNNHFAFPAFYVLAEQ